jgi:hypothetical protein
VYVSESGKGDGSSSMDSECGFVTFRGVLVPKPGRPALGEIPFSGVEGGEVFNLLRSLRVMWGRDWESSDASGGTLCQHLHCEIGLNAIYRRPSLHLLSPLLPSVSFPRCLPRVSP